MQLLIFTIFPLLHLSLTEANQSTKLDPPMLPLQETTTLSPEITSIESKKIAIVKTESRFQKPESSLNSIQTNEKNKFKESKGYSGNHHSEEKKNEPVPCTCGVFLSGQFKKGSKDQPKGVPVLTQETDTPFMNNAMGNRQCTNKCLELIIKHLPKSSEIICATVDRDEVFKERAYLFIKNHSDKWFGTNLSAGREFCCKDYTPYKCPLQR